MIARIVLPILMTFGIFMGNPSALAQSVGPDEAFDAQGSTLPSLALTTLQKRAIYSAVLRQKARTPLSANSLAIPLAVGAPVSPAADLSVLPEPTGVESWAAFLKYAMVQDDIVIVDSIRMRVVDIIHGRTQDDD
jgi:hypothetical protein